jgi:hypothetical protein
MMMMCARDEENKKLFFFSLSLSSRKKKKKMNRARWMSFLWCSWEIFVVDSFFIFWKKWTNARICGFRSRLERIIQAGGCKKKISLCCRNKQTG